MWKAIQDIDRFKKGDEVPAEIAEVWHQMYKKSPVARILVQKKAEEVKAEPKVHEETDINKDGKTDLLDLVAVVKGMLSKKSKADLYEEAAVLDISGRSSMTKKELAKAIAKAKQK